MELEYQSIMINSKEYTLNFQSNKYIVSNNKAAFCDELAKDFMPVVFVNKEKQDPQGLISESVYYIIQINSENKLCIIYEYLWPRQDSQMDFGCYNQIQIHFDLNKKILEKVVMSSNGSLSDPHHGVQVFLPTDKSNTHEVDFELNSVFPFKNERLPTISMKVSPMYELKFDNVSPVVASPSYAESFGPMPIIAETLSNYKKIDFDLGRLDEETVEELFFKKTKNFGHDISDPFKEPHIVFVIPSNLEKIHAKDTKESFSTKAKKLVPKNLGGISSKLIFSKK